MKPSGAAVRGEPRGPVRVQEDRTTAGADTHPRLPISFAPPRGHAHLSPVLPAAALRAVVFARPAALCLLGAPRAPLGRLSPAPRGAPGGPHPHAGPHLRQDRPGVLRPAGRGAGAVPHLAEHAHGQRAVRRLSGDRAGAGGRVRRARGRGVRGVRPRAAGGGVAGAGVQGALPRRGRGGEGAAPRRGAHRGARRALRAPGAGVGGAVLEPPAAARPARGDRRVRAPHRRRDGLSQGSGVLPGHRRQVRPQPARGRAPRDRRDGAPAHARAGVRGRHAGGPDRSARRARAWWTRSGWWTRWWRPTSR